MDNQILSMMQELRDGQMEMNKALGRLEEGQRSAAAYTRSVSDDVKQLSNRLDFHKEDDGAHGIKTTRRALGAALTILTFAVTCLEAWRVAKR